MRFLPCNDPDVADWLFLMGEPGPAPLKRWIHTPKPLSLTWSLLHEIHFRRVFRITGL